MDQKRALKQLRELKKRGVSMRLAADKWGSNYQTLIATILSARTRDEKTIPTAKKLFKKYLHADDLAKAKLRDVEKIIRPINFYKNKSKNIINCAKNIVGEHNSKIPRDFEKLINLPGVGRKTANVFLAVVGKDAIGVDTHLSYVSRKLNWTSNANPHKIETDLQNLFPRKYWRRLNYILVRFGRTYTSRKEKDKLLDKIKKIK